MRPILRKITDLTLYLNRFSFFYWNFNPALTQVSFLAFSAFFRCFFKTSEIVLMVKLRRRPFDFWGEGGEGYGWFQKEISRRLILRGKNILRRNTWGKNILHRKHTGICGEKRLEVWEKRSLTRTKSPIAPQKSNGRLLMLFPQEC